MIPHFLLNATPLALSLLTSQHPLRGNGEAARRTGEGERGKKKKKKKKELAPALVLSAPPKRRRRREEKKQEQLS